MLGLSLGSVGSAIMGSCPDVQPKARLSPQQIRPEVQAEITWLPP